MAADMNITRAQEELLLEPEISREEQLLEELVQLEEQPDVKSYAELTEAFAALKRNEKVTPTKGLYALFKSNDDRGTPDERIKTARKRFIDAYRIYQSVIDGVDGEQANDAFFYRTADRKAMFQEYFNLYEDLISYLLKQIEDHFHLPCSKKILLEILKITEKFYTDNLPKNPDRYTICIELITFFIARVEQKCDENFTMSVSSDINVDMLFGFNEKNVLISGLSDCRFYGVKDLTRSRKIGKIYEPKNHNHGVNRAWVLALVRKGLPIVLKSSTPYRGRTQSVDENRSDHPLPSAFALELAIAMKAGYICNVSDKPQCTITLVPPPGFKPEFCLMIDNHNQPSINPTPEEQFNCYDCFTILQNAIDAWKKNAGPDPRDFKFIRGQVTLYVINAIGNSKDQSMALKAKYIDQPADSRLQRSQVPGSERKDADEKSRQESMLGNNSGNRNVVPVNAGGLSRLYLAGNASSASQDAPERIALLRGLFAKVQNGDVKEAHELITKLNIHSNIGHPDQPDVLILAVATQVIDQGKRKNMIDMLKGEIMRQQPQLQSASMARRSS